ncbi:MAG: DUF3795 domain-containing protein [Candidatus Bathycorpusculaceae bacterium]
MQKANLWNLVAPCGLYCGECTAFLNKKCGGCRSNQGLSKRYRKYCKIYKCSDAKSLKICLECNEFPCKNFNFFKAERLEDSSWFLDIWSNMRQIAEIEVLHFLRKKAAWLNKRKKCASKRGIKYCDECKQWPCELLKRPVLVPADLNRFREFMEKAC